MLAPTNTVKDATLFLVGFPNAGKSTFFNLLTGGSRKVSNYSGVTVDSSQGELESNSSNNSQIRLIDLPGIYNLVPTSYDEGVTVQTILDLDNQNSGNKILLMLDYQRLEASMSLGLAVRDIVGDDNIVFIINKDDEKELTTQMRQEIETRTKVRTISISTINSDSKVLDDFIRSLDLSKKIHQNKKALLTREAFAFLPIGQHDEKIKVSSEKEISDLISWYHNKSRDVLHNLISPTGIKAQKTEKLDKIILNPFLGGIVFLAIFYFIFHAIYTWAGPVMDVIDGGVASFGDLVSGLLPDGMLKSLIVDGIIAGVGGVLVFLPQIMFLFFLLSILEQSGYVARAAVVTDKIMSIFGLNGKAFLPYMSGFACSIPGIMATRTLPNQRERLATLMTIPMITCSARLPVYILLVGTFVPDKTVLGFFNAQALSFFFLYFLGSAMALIVAKLLRLSFFKGESGNFIIDLPLYQRPSIKTALNQSWLKGRTFLKKAGTVILGLSILIWVLSTFPKADPSLLEGKTEEQVASISLEQSLLGTMGRTIEPVIKPIGMDWKMGVGLLVAFGARELFVSAMGTIYALGDVDEESEGLRERLTKEVDSVTGAPVYSLAVAWSILIFFVFSLQCTATLAILKKETGGWKIPVIMFAYMGGLAYVGSFIAYRMLS